MKLQKLLSYVRKACQTYEMIEENDKIAVGVSGGKDSQALLIALSHMQRFYPKRFELVAITVSLGFEGFDTTPVADLCASLGVEYSVVETSIGEIVFDIRKEPNPCSLCSKMRKGALNTEAKRLGCNKIALGHNKDDILQSFFMSLFYEGRVHTFSPVTHWDKMELYALRPLMFAPEKEIASFIRDEKILIAKNPCPVNGKTKREEIKQFIYAQGKNFDHFSDKIFTAIQNSQIDGYGKK